MKFVLFSVKHSRPGDALLWWGPDRRGYVTNLDHAGRYTEAEAREICRDGETTLPIPEDDLKRFYVPRYVDPMIGGNHDVLEIIKSEALERLNQ